MGYAATIPASVIEIGGALEAGFDLHTGVADIPISGAILIPSWLDGRIKHCYADMYFPYVYNDSAAGTNYTNPATQYIQVKINGGAWTNAIPISVTSFFCNASDGIMGTIRLPGSIDLTTIVSDLSSASIQFQWNDAQSLRDHLSFHNVYIVLRCYIE